MSHDELIARLEAAEEGSRELDLAIRGFVDQARSWRTLDPHYTTSLDAKLPWENIESSWKLKRGWQAEHRAPDGVIWVGQAKTEALARRAAALRGRAG